MADALRITKGVDAIIHLGGYSVEGPWEGILSANIIGCYNVFEAARRNGVKRIIFPTSNHAMGFYKRGQTIDHRVYIKPDSRYGVSKVFGEALGSLYADKYGMEFLMIRIGNVDPEPIDKRRLSICDQPARHRAARLRSASSTRHPLRDRLRHLGEHARLVRQRERFRLGYKPLDNSETYAAEVLAREKPGDATAEKYQGGVFCVPRKCRIRRRCRRRGRTGPHERGNSPRSPDLHARNQVATLRCTGNAGSPQTISVQALL